MRLHDQNVWKVLSSCISEKVDELDSIDCVRILKAFASFDDADSNLMSLVGISAMTKTHKLRVEDIALICEAFANHGLLHAPFFASMSIAFSMKISAATADDLLNMASAFAQVKLPDTELFSRIAIALLPQINACTPSQLSGLARAYASLHIREDTLLLAIANAATRKSAQFSPENIKDLLFAFSEFGLLFPDCAHALRQRISIAIAHIDNVEDIVELTISCSRLGIATTDFMAAVSYKLLQMRPDKESVLVDLPFDSFCELWSALASLKCGDELLLAQMVAESQRRLQRGFEDEINFKAQGIETDEDIQDNTSKIDAALPHLLTGVALLARHQNLRLTPSLIDTLVQPICMRISLAESEWDAATAQRLFRSLRLLPSASLPPSWVIRLAQTSMNPRLRTDPLPADEASLAGTELLARACLRRAASLSSLGTMPPEPIMHMLFDLLCLLPALPICKINHIFFEKPKLNTSLHSTLAAAPLYTSLSLPPVSHPPSEVSWTEFAALRALLPSITLPQEIAIEKISEEQLPPAFLPDRPIENEVFTPSQSLTFSPLPGPMVHSLQTAVRKLIDDDAVIDTYFPIGGCLLTVACEKLKKGWVLLTENDFIEGASDSTVAHEQYSNYKDILTAERVPRGMELIPERVVGIHALKSLGWDVTVLTFYEVRKQKGGDLSKLIRDLHFSTVEKS